MIEQKEGITMLVKCPQCHGKGEYNAIAEDNNKPYPVKCTVCEGTGKVEKSMTANRKRKLKTV